MKRLMLAMTLAAAAPSIASAQTVIFASGKVYGGPSQTLAICYLYNAGTAPITLTGLGLRNQTGARQQPFSDTCGSSLGGGQGCNMQAYITNTVPWDCSVGADPAADLRGSLELRKYFGSGTAVVLQSQPMR